MISQARDFLVRAAQVYQARGSVAWQIAPGDGELVTEARVQRGDVCQDEGHGVPPGIT